MFAKSIHCAECGKDYPLSYADARCTCGGSLEVLMDYRKLSRLKRKDILARPFNHSRYAEFFPVRKLVSIQEGGTPLVRSKRIEKEFKLSFKLYFKYEAQNPTGSFKDRGSSVEIARALEKKAKHVVCASTGNMGASVSAYSAMSGLKCSILSPEDTAFVKMEQILAYGARLYHLKGDYTEAARMVEQLTKRKSLYMLGDYLWRREGTKSVGYEICDQLPNMDHVVCPVGNGTLISATWKAFQEFYTLGWLKKLPLISGIQSSKCSPVYQDFSGKPRKRCGHTVAVAIECGDPLDGKRALSAIKESGGTCITVTDEEILKCRELLAQKEGLFAEPAGAVALAGILKNKKSFRKGSNVVCLVTGHGLKTPRTGVKGKPIEVKSTG
ncbi:MAG: threonine synthase, partial [Candidatus Aenigmarchaeota archaeon]